MKHEPQPKLRKVKVNAYLEDEEARIFLKGIIPSAIRKELKIRKFNLGANSYETLLKEKFPEFKHSLIILDGDKSTTKSLKRSKNALFLPGTARPENVLLDYLDGLPIDNNFWDSDLGGYNQQVFLGNKPADTTQRETMKRWFNSEKKYWGKGCRKLLNQWKKDNKAVVDRFCKTLEKKIEALKS